MTVAAILAFTIAACGASNTSTGVSSPSNANSGSDSVTSDTSTDDTETDDEVVEDTNPGSGDTNAQTPVDDGNPQRGDTGAEAQANDGNPQRVETTAEAPANADSQNDPKVEPTEQESAIIGLSLADAQSWAEQNGRLVRVLKKDGKLVPATKDYVPERINVVVDRGIVTAIHGFG